MDYEETLMAKIAWYYYFENMTQQTISDRMGMSRARVMKLLEKARQTGVIQFHLRKGNEDRMALEKQLIDQFHLEDALVVPAAVKKSETNANVAEAASMYIAERLQDGSVINIGYGDTPSKILNNLATMAESPITCVSLTGGVSYYLPDARSNVFNARLHLIPAPLIASGPDMAQAMRQESSVLEISRMISLAQLTVVGIGSMHDSATIIRSGILNNNDLLYLKMQGAQGDMLCHFLDENGRVLDTPLESRLISTPLDKLKELRHVIGVAAGDVKADAIRAALRGGYLDMLITDDTTAAQLVAKQST